VGATRRAFKPAMGETLSPQLQAALAPLLSVVETITERIREYDAQIEKLAEESYPVVALLKQVKGVGTLIALTYILTLEDPRRFRKSRDAGCYVDSSRGGGTPGKANVNCISREKETLTYGWFWYKAHNTSWDRSERTPICAGGD
jgi:transposase